MSELKPNIVGLSGAQGTGKSTIIDGMCERFDTRFFLSMTTADDSAHWRVRQSHISRTVQEKLGWPDLASGVKNEKTMWEFQNAVLDALDERDSKIQTSGAGQVTLVDRTPIDVCCYTEHWLTGMRGQFTVATVASMAAFRFRCYQLMQRYSICIYVPIIPEIPFVQEARRADEESQKTIDQMIASTIAMRHFRHHQLVSVSVEDRLNEVEAVLNLAKFYL